MRSIRAMSVSTHAHIAGLGASQMPSSAVILTSRSQSPALKVIIAAIDIFEARIERKGDLVELCNSCLNQHTG